MADLIIRGMELPESCGMCDHQGLKNAIWHFGYGCKGDIDDFSNCPPSYCPLLPLQEGHGRMIDADALLRDNPEFADRDFCHPKYDLTLRELIESAPTIVPAEGGKIE